MTIARCQDCLHLYNIDLSPNCPNCQESNYDFVPPENHLDSEVDEVSDEEVLYIPSGLNNYEPPYIDKFLNTGEEVMFCGDFKYIQLQDVALYDTEDGHLTKETDKTIYQWTSEKKLKVTLVFTDSRLFIIEYKRGLFSGEIKSIKNWEWTTYSGIDHLEIKSIRDKYGNITDYRMYRGTPKNDHIISDSMENLKFLNSLFENYGEITSTMLI